MDADHSDLSLEDVEFLQAVQTINENPDEHENTDEGKTAATTSAIRVNSRLDREQVKYRSRPSDTLEGLITIHKAEFDPETRTFGPTSVELTDAGREALAAYQQEHEGASASTTAPSDTVEELERRIERLENVDMDGDIDAAEISAELQSLRSTVDDLESDIQRIDEDVQAIKSASFGALNEDIADKLDSALYKLPGVLYLLDALFDVQAKEISEHGAFDDEELVAARARIFGMLSAAAESDATGDTPSNDTPVAEEMVSGEDTADNGAPAEPTPPVGTDVDEE